jgi:hypothetical protein
MILNHCQIVVERKLLRHITDVLAHRFRVPAHVVTCDLRMAGGGFEQPTEHANRRGFARTVRPEKAEDLALADFKIDMIHSDKSAEALGQLINHN